MMVEQLKPGLQGPLNRLNRGEGGPQSRRQREGLKKAKEKVYKEGFNPNDRFNEGLSIEKTDRHTPYDALHDDERNLAGEKFGRWTVLGKEPILVFAKNGLRYDKWMCRCECGLKKTVGGNDLRMGRSQGCAPCRWERQRKAKSGKNRKKPRAG